MSNSKRKFLMATGVFAAFGASSRVVRADDSNATRPPASDKPLPRTPSGDLGPFYPVEPPLGTDFDLTRVREGGPPARGTLIEISGRVLYRDGTPQTNARLEIWQANDEAAERTIDVGCRRKALSIRHRPLSRTLRPRHRGPHGLDKTSLANGKLTQATERRDAAARLGC